MDPEEKQRNDRVGIGFLIAFACQLVTLVAPLAIFKTVTILVYWGLFQWIALLPLYLLSKSKGYPLQGKGILIVGFLGMLLNVACVAYFQSH